MSSEREHIQVLAVVGLNVMYCMEWVNELRRFGTVRIERRYVDVGNPKNKAGATVIAGEMFCELHEVEKVLDDIKRVSWFFRCVSSWNWHRDIVPSWVDDYLE